MSPLSADFPALPAVTVFPKEVGTRYHVAIGTIDGTRLYGYLLDPSSQDAFAQITDVTSRDRLLQASSPNLTDRDLTAFPRVTDGNFSGGQNQITFIDPTKYWDGELDIQEPGYLKLRASWGRYTFAPGQTGSQNPQITPGFGNPGGFSQKAYMVFGPITGAGNSVVYASDGTVIAAPTAPSTIQGDPSGLFYGDSNGDVYYLKQPGGSWSRIVSLVLNGDFWIVDQGTAGLWLYYNALLPASGTNASQYVLRRVDLSMVVNSLAPTLQVGAAVPWGAEVRSVTDICSYLSEVAILINTPAGIQLWTHDGTISNKLLDLPGYQSFGLCNVLGTLYAGLNPISGYGSSLLIAITGSTFQVVSQFGRNNALNRVRLGAAHGGEFRVYFVVQRSPGDKVIGQFDVRSGAVSRDEPYLTMNDNPPMTHRGIVIFGDQAVGFAQLNTAEGAGGSGPIQLLAKSTSNLLGPGSPPAYLAQVMVDAPLHYYRMDNAGINNPGNTETDIGSGANNIVYDNDPSSFGWQTTPGMLAITGDNDAAVQLFGSPGNSNQGARNPSPLGTNYVGDFHVEFGLLLDPTTRLTISGAGALLPLLRWGNDGTFNTLAIYLHADGTTGQGPYFLNLITQSVNINVPITSIVDGFRHLIQFDWGSANSLQVKIDNNAVLTYALGGPPAIDGRGRVIIGPDPNQPAVNQSRLYQTYLDMDEVSIILSSLSTSRMINHYVSWSPPPLSVPTYEPTGALTSSRIDFNTPSIHKLIRRATATHAPLTAGQGIQLLIYLDQDPSNLGMPSIIGNTNMTVGSTETVVTMPLNTQAKTITFKIVLFAGDMSAATTPIVNHVAIEATTPFVWELKLPLSHKREDLRGREDTETQGLSAADLKHLLDFIWLSGQTAVFIDPDRLKWNVVMENYRFDSRSPKRDSTNLTEADLEGVATVKLRALPG